jgi:hypothetical protein
MNMISTIQSNVFTNKKIDIDIIDPTGLVLYYKFSSVDVSGTTIANWATGTPVFDAVLNGTTNVVSNQLSTLTSGTRQNGIVINRSIPRTGFTGLSFSFWFNASFLPGNNYPFLVTIQDALGYPSGNRFYISLYPGNFLSINGQMGSTGTTQMTVNTLYHIAVVVNSSGNPNTTLYINNVSQTGNTSYPTFTNVSGFNSINRDPVGDGLIGTIDDYRLHNRSLTAREVNTLFITGRSV